MKTFILFIYGTFEDHGEVEFFCMEILADLPSVKALRYVIETNPQNIIVIFDSEEDNKTISEDLLSAMVNETIKFYFVFPLDKIITAHVPEQLKDFMFKPNSETPGIKIEYIKTKTNKFDLDEVLEKIKKLGLESLTNEEKKFLDDFE